MRLAARGTVPLSRGLPGPAQAAGAASIAAHTGGADRQMAVQTRQKSTARRLVRAVRRSRARSLRRILLVHPGT